MKKWLIFRPDGGFEQFTEGPKHRGRRDHPRRHYPDDHEFVEVNRHTANPAGESYDRRAKRWVPHSDASSFARAGELNAMSNSELFAEIEKMVDAKIAAATLTSTTKK